MPPSKIIQGIYKKCLTLLYRGYIIRIGTGYKLKNEERRYNEKLL